MDEQYNLSQQEFHRTLYCRVIFGCGLLLAAGELYKQLFLYFILFDRQYNWWYLPFQLCSIPMYLCLLIPFVPAGLRRTFCTFLQDFGILGGIAALMVPAGFTDLHITLSIHGYLWHFMLIFLGIYSSACGYSDRRISGYLHALALFGLCSLTAFAIDILIPEADMFYISPYYPTTQPIFHWFAMRLGISAANLIYLASVAVGALLVHAVCSLYFRLRIK